MRGIDVPERNMTIADKLLFRTGTCPWWLCFTFDNPLRRVLQNPRMILEGVVQRGQTALDIGCGMGYFSIPLAQLVGHSGIVTCVDLQQHMLDAARQRAERAGVSDIVKFHRCTHDSLGLTGKADFALAFWMVHEVPDKQRFLREIKEALKPHGQLLLAEPRLHVSRRGFDATVSTAVSAGFQIAAEPRVSMSMAVLLKHVDGND
jgi:ubiquinone/menaquinone biosynthesis C-methylase UbiE